MNIKFYYGSYVFVLAIIIALLVSVFLLPKPVAEPKAIPVLLAYNEAQNNRSSVVHIGNGYFLTAAHILGKDQTQLVMETSLGQRLIADLLWSSHQYDISLLYSKDYDQVSIEQYDLDCGKVTLGQELIFVGNPTHLNFIHTWGRVSSDAIEVPMMWRRAIPVNAAILPGMSGGAVLDTDGNLKGINVGTMTAISGMTALGPQVSFTGLSYIVEASDICFLMGIK
jgi:S1-C subfamily serine protease